MINKLLRTFSRNTSEDYYSDRRLNAVLFAEQSGSSGVNHNILSAYRTIDIVNRSVNTIADACVRVPFIVKPFNEKNRDDIGFAKKLNNILARNPNPYEDRYDLLKKGIMDYILYGNAYFYIAKNYLYVLNASNVKVKVTPSKVAGELNKVYEETFVDKGKNKTTVTYKQEEIIHIQQNDPNNRYEGRSRIFSIISVINLYAELDRFQKFFFKNNAVPGFAISLGEGISDKKVDKMAEDLKIAYSANSDNARSLMVLNNGAKIERFSEINFKNLDFEQSKIRLERHICDVIGVPHSIVFGSENENTKANQERFYKYTVLPILDQLGSAFEHYYSGLIKVVPDRFSIEALREDSDKRSARLRSLVATGIMSVNEARKEEGLPPLDDEYANKPWIPENIAGSAVNPDLGGRPSE